MLGLFGVALAVSLSALWSTPAHADWTVPLGSPSSSSRLEDLFFVNASEGCVIKFGGSFYRTTNGAVSWTHIANTPEALYRSLAFVDVQHGWIGTLTEATPLLATTDGGDTWSAVPGLAPTVKGICGMYVVNSQVVYGCGVYYGTPRVIKTTDAGASWQVMNLSALAGTLIDCYFSSPTTGIVVGGVGPFGGTTRAGVFRTTNGGMTWQTQHVGSRQGEWCWKITFPSANVGYVSVEGQEQAQQMVLKTTDGGITWTELLTVTNVDMQGIGFIDDTTGWVGGWEGTTSKTTDGGLSWVSDPWGENVNSFFRVSPTLAYAVGTQFHKYEVDVAAAPSLVWGARSIDSRTIGNPFRSSTQIAYRLDENVAAHLSIYSPAGGLVCSIDAGTQAPGLHRVSWDARDETGREVTPGVYFYRISAGTRTGGGKLQLVR